LLAASALEPLMQARTGGCAGRGGSDPTNRPVVVPLRSTHLPRPFPPLSSPAAPARPATGLVQPVRAGVELRPRCSVWAAARRPAGREPGSDGRRGRRDCVACQDAHRLRGRRRHCHAGRLAGVWEPLERGRTGGCARPAACGLLHQARLRPSAAPRLTGLPSPILPQPTFEVLAVAVNSGLAAFPTAYSRVWCGGGAAVWRPVPPPGYVAAGDIFTADGAEPELSAMVCLHGEKCRSRGRDGRLAGAAHASLSSRAETTTAALLNS
jgi:hypothetical protein